MESRTVSDKNDKHDELLTAVEKSEARLKSDSGTAAPDDRSPPEKVTQLIREHPGLAVAAGLGLGLIAAILIPKGPGRKLLRRGGLVATAATEMALVLGKQAIAKAGEVTEEGREHVGEAAQRAAAAGRAAGRNVKRLAGDTSAAARGASRDLADKADKALSRLRK
jgi:hypothetical protein